MYRRYQSIVGTCIFLNSYRRIPKIYLSVFVVVIYSKYLIHMYNRILIFLFQLMSPNIAVGELAYIGPNVVTVLVVYLFTFPTLL